MNLNCLKTFLSSLLLFGANAFISHSSYANQNDSESTHHETKVKANLIAQHHESDDTWLSGNLGRYDLSSNHLLAELQLAYRYHFNQNLHVKTHIQAQHSSESRSSNSIGLVEWQVSYKKDIDWQHSFSLSAGQFFLPTSLENADSFWESPYSIHFSALNSWIGEEFRPIGVDAQYHYFTESNSRISLATTIFGGNDSMGALLAYRGWSIGRHRTALGDIVSLPDLDLLSDTGNFGAQRDEGTRPFGKELDNRPGYALHSQYRSDNLLLSFAWVDNRGDRKLHRGEYAWDTKFYVLGAAWLINENWELLSEATQGSSTMGAGPGVDIDFYSAYIMGSYLNGDKRISLRAEQFGSNDNDQVDQENNDLGRAITLGLSWLPENSHFRADLETIYLNSKRARTIDSNTIQDDESWSVSFMLSYTL